MPDRARWDEKGWDDLEDRVDDLEAEMLSLRLLPERVANLKEMVDLLREEVRDGDRREERRIVSLRADMKERFDKLDNTGNRNGKLLNWIAAFAAILAASAPIAAAVVLVGGGP